MGCRRVVGAATLLLGLLVVGCQAQTYSHSALATKDSNGDFDQAVLFFPSLADPAVPASVIPTASIFVERSTDAAFTSPQAVAGTPTLRAAIGLYELADPVASWPSAGTAPWYRVTRCTNAAAATLAACAAGDLRTSAAAQPTIFTHTGVFTLPAYGTSAAVVFPSLGPSFTYLVERAAAAGFASPAPVAATLPAAAGMAFAMDTQADWADDTSPGAAAGAKQTPWYRVSLCLDPSDAACTARISTQPAQPATMQAVLGAYEPHNVFAATKAVVMFPAVPLGMLTLERSADASFATPSPLGAPSLSIWGQWHAVADLTAGWADDMTNPGDKSAPYYRLVWCLDGAACEATVTSPSAQPAPFLHFGAFLPPPGYLPAYAAPMAAMGGPVVLNLFHLGPFWSLTLQKSSTPDFATPTDVGPVAVPSDLTKPTTAMDTSASWQDNADGTAKLTPYYRVRACLVTPGGCTDAALYTPAAQPLPQLGPNGLNAFASFSAQPSPPNCGNLFYFNLATGQVEPQLCSSVQDAINSVVASGGSAVYLLAGFYGGPGNNDLDFQGAAITLSSTNGKAFTYISGGAVDIPALGISLPATRVFAPMPNTIGPGTVIEGLTIALGSKDRGGCMRLDGASPIIKDARFLGCSATVMGGAVYVTDGGGPTFVSTSFVGGTAPEGGCLGLDEAGSVTVTGVPPLAFSTFLACKATSLISGGGGIYSLKSDLSVQLSVFFFNNGTMGGAINAVESTLSLAFSSLTLGIAMDAGGKGGNIHGHSSTITIANSTFSQGYAYNGGGAAWLEKCSVTIVGSNATECFTVQFGGAFVFFESNVTVTDAFLERNVAISLAGGIMHSKGNVVLTNVDVSRNNGAGASGAFQVLSGNLTVINSRMVGNSGGNGGVAQIAKTEIGLTHLYFKDVVFDRNVADSLGGVFQIESFDTLVLDGCVFSNNAAVYGAAMSCKPTVHFPSTLMVLNNSELTGNVALVGAGVYAYPTCRLLVESTAFTGNRAVDYGSALVTTDTSEVSITRGSSFTNNGVPPPGQDFIKPPKGGGAIMVGFVTYNPKSDGSVAPTPARLRIEGGTTFSGNRALDAGAAILVESGDLVIDGAEILGSVTESPNSMGGGIALNERCPTPSSCTTVTADLRNLRLQGNRAQAAGGALSYQGGSAGGQLLISDSVLEGNSVSEDANIQGVGGGIYIGRPRFRVDRTEFTENSAFYGGGIFVGADQSSAGTGASQLAFTNNTAQLGPAVYWLRFLSLGAEFDRAACTVTPNDPTAISTEVLAAGFASAPPTYVQSNRESGAFNISLLDFYGNVAAAETGGSCTVDALVHPVAQAVVRSLGATEAVSNGIAPFTRLQMQGRIGENYTLSVACELPVLGRTRYLQREATPAVPLLNMDVHVGACPAGTQPNKANDGCVDCAYGTYNFDGGVCNACPDGAVCPGGDEVLSEANWWRSTYQSADFYACKAPGVCLPGPVAGDESCLQGQHGPLCAVCDPQHYKFSGGCKPCGAGGQARGMLAAAIILASLLVTAMFARDWDFGSGPGILTKIKILLTHFQMMALFRDYDLVFPDSTKSAFSWFEFLNVGLTITAPECFVGQAYNFYWFYVFTMALPFISVGLCVFTWVVAHLILKRLDPSGQRRLVRKGFVGWLGGLQIRCWKNAFWFVTLLYPRSTMTALQLFGLQRLSTGWYLAADFSIMTKPLSGTVSATYIKYMVPGIALLIVFAVVIPALWFLILWYNRTQLDDPVVAAKYGFLYSSYSRRLPYWETTEMLRKFIIALLPVFIKPQSTGSLQAAVGQIVMVFYLLLTCLLRPFANPLDNSLQIGSLCVLFLMLLSGAAAKWANLSQAGDQGLATGQLLLTSLVGVVLGGAVFFNGLAILRRFLRNRRQRTAKVASFSEGSAGAPPSKDVPLATIRVKAGAGATDDAEGGAGTLGVGYAHLGAAGSAPSSGYPSPERRGGGEETPRGDDTPRGHGDESPLLKKHRKTGQSSSGGGGGGGGRSTGGGEGGAVPASSTFVANPRVEQWIESSFDKAAVGKHIAAEKERTGGAASPSRTTPRGGGASHSGEPAPMPKGDPLNLSLRD